MAFLDIVIKRSKLLTFFSHGPTLSPLAPRTADGLSSVLVNSATNNVHFSSGVTP